jgi:hypothetical protein
LLYGAATFAGSPATPNAKVSIVSPKDGDTVSNPVTIKFGIDGMAVAPAGTDKPFSGHHHLLIDVDTLPAMDAPLPKSDNLRHFGGGQTEASLTLSPGTHTLQLILGDKDHIPHTPPVMSEKITITVQ